MFLLEWSYQHMRCATSLHWLKSNTSRKWTAARWRKTKTSVILYHGPVWITLNSFIWNIKTMKHKPSTKSDSYKCRTIRLLKMNRLYWKTTVFFFIEWWSRYTEQTVRCEHDYAIYTLQILTDSRRREKERKDFKKEEKKKQGKSRRKWNSDIHLTAAWSACGSGCTPRFSNRALVNGQNE